MDIFGHALRDWQSGRRDRRLTIRRDDDHVDAHDPALYFALDPAAHEVALLRRAKGPVLDVRCGPGRTVLWLERRRIAVTGLDLSPGAVEVARARGCTDVRLGDIMAGGGSHVAGERFRSIILFGNNVGIGGTIEGAGVLLRRLADMTVDGGQLLVTGLDIARTDNPRHLAYHEANRARGRPRGEITMRFEYGGKAGNWVRWFHPEPDELAQLARDAGWDADESVPVDGSFFAVALRKPG